MARHFLRSPSALALTLSLTFTAAARADRYTVTDLGTAGGDTSSANAINDQGVIVGTSDNKDGAKRPVVYSGGKMTDLGAPPGHQGTATAVNNQGQAVGNWTGTGGQSRVFLHSGGTTKDLGTFGADRSTASGINDAGLIVGTVSGPSTGIHGFTYDGSKVTPITSGPLQTSSAHAVNNAGQVVGEFASAGSGSQGYVSDRGKLTELPAAARGTVVPAAISNVGQVVGQELLPAGTAPYSYKDGKPEMLGTLGGTDGKALGVNDAGAVVGYSTTKAMEQRAFLSENGKMQDLNSLIPPESHWDLLAAKDINNKGQIVGEGINPEGLRRGFLLTPMSEVPEPGCLALLGAGAAGVAGYAWRKRKALRRCGPSGVA